MTSWLFPVYHYIRYLMQGWSRIGRIFFSSPKSTHTIVQQLSTLTWYVIQLITLVLSSYHFRTATNLNMKGLCSCVCIVKKSILPTSFIIFSPQQNVRHMWKWMWFHHDKQSQIQQWINHFIFRWWYGCIMYKMCGRFKPMSQPLTYHTCGHTPYRKTRCPRQYHPTSLLFNEKSNLHIMGVNGYSISSSESICVRINRNRTWDHAWCVSVCVNQYIGKWMVIVWGKGIFA